MTLSCAHITTHETAEAILILQQYRYCSVGMHNFLCPRILRQFLGHKFDSHPAWENADTAALPVTRIQTFLARPCPREALLHTEKLPSVLSRATGMADKAGEFGGAIREDSRKTRPRAGQLMSTLHASGSGDGDSQEIVLCIHSINKKAPCQPGGGGALRDDGRSTT